LKELFAKKNWRNYTKAKINSSHDTILYLDESLAKDMIITTNWDAEQERRHSEEVSKAPTSGTESDGNGISELVDAGREPTAACPVGRYDLDVCPHHEAALHPDRLR
jgi:hypothetical protein